MAGPRSGPRRWGTVSSVRARTTLLACAVVAFTLIAGAVGLLATLEHSLTTNRDELSRTQLSTLAAQAAEGRCPALSAISARTRLRRRFSRPGRY